MVPFTVSVNASMVIFPFASTVMFAAVLTAVLTFEARALSSILPSPSTVMLAALLMAPWAVVLSAEISILPLPSMVIPAFLTRPMAVPDTPSVNASMEIRPLVIRNCVFCCRPVSTSRALTTSAVILSRCTAISA